MPTLTIDLQNAGIQFEDLLALVTAGTEVSLTDGDTPVARVVPVAFPAGKRTPGLHAGAVWMSPDFDAPLSDGFWAGPA